LIKQHEHLKEWIAYFYLGISIGTIAFIMTMVEEYVSEIIIHTVEHHIARNLEKGTNWDIYYAPWLGYAFICGFCGLISGVITTYYGPGAAGSGVAEFIGYINGIN
jgi:hypothetical protein